MSDDGGSAETDRTIRDRGGRRGHPQAPRYALSRRHRKLYRRAEQPPRRGYSTSNYEYPGRYTRWDTAIIDPPVGRFSARGRQMRIEALNRRGEALLPMLLKAIEPLKDVAIESRAPRLVTLGIAAPRSVFTEEERSRVP